jgi:putative salt-induced outer membrane protein YdiY
VKVVEGSKKEQTGSSGPAVPKLDVPQDPLGFGALLREPWQLMSEPWQFLTEKSFSNSVELGLNGTEGNSQTTSLHAGFDLLWQSVQYRLRSNLNYQQTHADSKETQNNALWDNDWERMLGQTPWSWTTELMLEYDEFRNFDLRLVMNTGLGYYWIRRENASFSTRIGSGTSREFGGPSTEWKPEARFGAEGEYRFTPRQKFTGKADYYPAWDDFNDFRLVATLSWEILLDGSDNLSLKLFAQDRYDSTPEGRLPNDINYSALLLYKF